MRSPAATEPNPNPANVTSTSQTVSLPSLYLMRAGYLFMALGLAITRWPILIGHDTFLAPMEGVVLCMLFAQSLLFFLGVRYPLQMIPILLFELAWKVIWLSTVALPLWLAGDLNGANASIAINCSLLVIVLIILPWPHLVRQYVTKRGDRWLPARPLTPVPPTR
ncbi:hypothetical protein [Arthrobacter sp. D2-10]